MLRTLLNLALTLALGYAAIVFLAYLLQDRLLYFPSRKLVASPAHVGLRFEAVSFDTEDGETLDGWWIPAEPQRAVLLFCHGNAGNISHRLESVDVFHRLGLSVLLFDYRGYGRSTGRPSEAGLYRDGEAAWRYLTHTRRVDSLDVILYGRSLGGAVATHLAAQHRSGALIVESAFTSVPDVAARHYPYLPVRALARTRFDNLGAIATVQTPLLVIHSRHDEIIPFEHGQRLFEAAPSRKVFLEIEGGHNNGFLVTGPRYRDAIDAFLRNHLGR